MKRAEDRGRTADLAKTLMGRRPELRFHSIQERARTVQADAVDV